MKPGDEQPASAILSAAEVQDRYGIDLTTAEVLRHALEHVAMQMQVSINTAALSPLLSEVNDFGIGLLAPCDPARDLDFDAVAMGTAAPAHYVINQFYARMAITHWGVENLSPGDVLVYNEPYQGGSHTNDIGTAMPIFVDGKLMGFAAAITHWMDIGGPVPIGLGPGLQRDMYAEGIRISPRLLYRQGKPVRETIELFTEQTRIPDISSNDLQVIRAALKLGADMVEQYVRRYGSEAYASGVQYTLDSTERAMRRALSSLPDGDYVAEDYLDSDMDGNPMLLHCTVRKYGDEVEVDYSGSSREEWGGFACTWSDAVSGAHLGLQVALSEAISPNAGAYRPVHVVVPPGCCLHALPPMSTNAGHTMFIAKAINIVKAALSQATPELALAENYDDVPFLSFSGNDDRGGVPAPFVYVSPFLGPFGGTASDDGCCYTLMEGANCVSTSVELDELTYPLLFLAREFVTDSAGAGTFRGGPATRIEVVPLVDAHSIYQLEQCRFHAQGARGGGSGKRAFIGVHRGGLERWARGDALGDPEILAGLVDSDGRLVDGDETGSTEFRLSKRTGVPCRAGDIIVFQVGGAGGCGEPAARSRDAVVRDVRNGIVSPQAAASLYGYDAESD